MRYHRLDVEMKTCKTAETKSLLGVTKMYRREQKHAHKDTCVIYTITRRMSDKL